MLLKYLNNFHERLKFTFEKEGEKLEKNSTNFLDILIKRNYDGTVSLDLYKKPTFSERYVNFLSNHSIAIKKGIVKNLIQKIFNLSDPQFHHKNIINLKKDLLLNNYPESFINSQIKNAFFRKNNSTFKIIEK